MIPSGAGLAPFSCNVDVDADVVVVVVRVVSLVSRAGSCSGGYPSMDALFLLEVVVVDGGGVPAMPDSESTDSLDGLSWERDSRSESDSWASGLSGDSLRDF